MSSTRAIGIALAFVTALISGVAVYVNAHAVKHFGDATVYTTAKNAVAGALLLALALPVLTPSGGKRLPRSRPKQLGLVAVAVVGGSVPFVLFFEGLAPAAPRAARTGPRRRDRPSPGGPVVARR
jgi:drug/metabolite transporter (DMT)-like permease